MKYNIEIQNKILKYHELLKNNQDTTSIKSEIDNYTKEYINQLNDTLNQIRDDKHVIEQKEVSHDVIDKNDYKLLIELYRKALDLSRDISKYKKHLRELMKEEN